MDAKRGIILAAGLGFFNIANEMVKNLPKGTDLFFPFLCYIAALLMFSIALNQDGIK